MKIKWNPSARADMRQVARYVNKTFGRKARQDHITGQWNDFEKTLEKTEEHNVRAVLVF